jgi:hypothetical protein
MVAAVPQNTSWKKNLAQSGIPSRRWRKKRRRRHRPQRERYPRRYEEETLQSHKAIAVTEHEAPAQYEKAQRRYREYDEVFREDINGVFRPGQSALDSGKSQVHKEHQEARKEHPYSIDHYFCVHCYFPFSTILLNRVSIKKQRRFLSQENIFVSSHHMQLFGASLEAIILPRILENAILFEKFKIISISFIT